MFNLFNKRFISDQKYKQLQKKQIEMLPSLLQALAKHGITEESEHQLQFYFYSNSEKKASGLASDLQKLSYSLQPISKNNRGEFSIKGLTTKTSINQKNLESWILQMLERGYKNDCEFDGFEVAVSK